MFPVTEKPTPIGRDSEVKKLAITLGIVIVLLVAADFGGAAIAASQVSKQVRSQLHLAEDPSVQIHGFPFLYQAVSGDYRDVEINANSVPLGELHDVGVGAHLRHARIPLSDVVAGNTDRLTVDDVAGSMKLKSADVGQLIGIDNLDIKPAPAEASGQGSQAPVTLDGSLNIAGKDLRVSVTAVLALQDSKLRIKPRDIKLADSSLSDIPLGKVFEKSILQQFSTTVDPGTLPFKIKPTGVHAEPGALVIDGTTSNITMGANGVTAR